MSNVVKDIDYYMGLPWSFTVEKKTDEGEYFFVRVNELECFSEGQTPQEAMSNIVEALKLHIESSLEEGQEIPEPLKPDDFKGVITYRTTPDKHFRLAKEAKRRRITVNRLVDETIDKAFPA